MSKYAPRNDAGQFAYVLTKRSWGKSWDRIVWAVNLQDAKAKWGYTREMYTTCSVRRATVDDLVAASATVRTGVNSSLKTDT